MSAPGVEYRASTPRSVEPAKAERPKASRGPGGNSSSARPEAPPWSSRPTDGRIVWRAVPTGRAFVAWVRRPEGENARSQSREGFRIDCALSLNGRQLVLRQAVAQSPEGTAQIVHHLVAGVDAAARALLDERIRLGPRWLTQGALFRKSQRASLM